MRPILLISLLFFCQLLFSQNSLTGTNIISGVQISATGDRYATSKTSPLRDRNYWVEDSYVLISLSYNIEDPTLPRPLGKVNMVVSFSYEVEKDKGFVTETRTGILNLNFDNDAFKDISFIKIPDAQKVNVQVLPGNFTISPDLYNENLKLEVSVFTKSFEKLGINGIAAPFQLSHEVNLSSDGDLVVNWSEISGADHYELEWTYVSNQDGSDVEKTKALDKLAVNRFLFRNNSSRVEVSGLSYNIPMIYEKGIILYRLRGVGKNVANNEPVPFKTKWTVEDGIYTYVGDYPNYFEFDGHEELINWQSFISFAEEGKHKLVLSYHDGSARNRQAVTRINTDQRSVVGETFYDYNGRPVIQLLPVPVKDNTYTYFPDFNLLAGEDQVQKEDYDKAAEGKSCEAVGPVFKNTTGASNYYSSENNFETGGNTGDKLLNKNLIPDAEGYPYTQTVYTSDNTGRIKAQSGVGATHRVASGKETKYQYAAPQQPEITRLFGNQIGHASHYKKNTVIDPNGQVSVSYLDLDGKVVATALAGGNPSTVDPLAGDFSREIEADLLASEDANRIALDALSIVYNSKINVAQKTTYTFDYKATLQPYTVNCVVDPTTSYSFDPAVIADITLTDNCGDIKLDGSDILNGGYSGTQNQQINIPVSELSKELEQGEYQIVKLLKVDEAKLETYWGEYLKKPNCLLDSAYFFDDEMAKIDTRGCGLTCESCFQEVDKMEATGDYSQAVLLGLRDACAKICKDEGIGCRANLQAMLGDLSPGGQYGKLRKEKISQPGTTEASIDENGRPSEPKVDITINNSDGGIFDAGNPEDNIVDASSFPMSIFNQGNRLRVSEFLRIQGLLDADATYKYPLKITHAGFSKDNTLNQIVYSEYLKEGTTYAITNYLNQFGDIVKVEITDNGDETYSPAIWDDAEREAIEGTSNKYLIPVRFLDDLAVFESLWESHWANYLLPYHPEYEYLIDCLTKVESHDFDYVFNSISQVDLAGNAAEILKYYTLSGEEVPFLDNGKSVLLDKDPYFKNSPIQKAYMKYIMDHYKVDASIEYSMVEFANRTVQCPLGVSTIDCAADCNKKNTIETDEVWNVFKAFYLAEKQKIMRTLAAKKASDGGYYNGCIGHADYLDLPESIFMKEIEVNTVGTTKYRYKCSFSWNIFKSNKICSFEQYTAYKNIYTVKYLNPGQLCHLDAANNYKGKTQRFWPQVASGVKGRPQTNCTTIIESEFEHFEVPIPCNEDIEAARLEAEESARRFMFESCGLCPMASDLEVFLMNLNDRTQDIGGQTSKYLFSNHEIINCDKPDSDIIAGMAIRDALNFESGESYYWNGTLSAGDKTLTGTIVDGGNNIVMTVSLILPAGSATFPNLTSMCCLQTLRNSEISQYDFTMKFTSNDGSNIVEGLLQGSINYAGGNQNRIPLYPCEFSPKCSITDDATNAVNFLNILTLSSETLLDKSKILYTNNEPENFTGGDHMNYINPAIRALYRKNDISVENGFVDDMSVYTPTWSSNFDLATGNLFGTLSLAIGTLNFEISGLIQGDMSVLKEFRNIQALKPGEEGGSFSHNGALVSQPFSAKAIFSNEAEPKTVMIYLSDLNPVYCQEIIVPSN